MVIEKGDKVYVNGQYDGRYWYKATVLDTYMNGTILKLLAKPAWGKKARSFFIPANRVRMADEKAKEPTLT